VCSHNPHGYNTPLQKSIVKWLQVTKDPFRDSGCPGFEDNRDRSAYNLKGKEPLDSQKLKFPEHYKPGDACPFCDAKKSDVFSAENFNEDKSSYFLIHHCQKCDKVWKDVYTYSATITVD
jgi:hypothetical protein